MFLLSEVILSRKLAVNQEFPSDCRRLAAGAAKRLTREPFMSNDQTHVEQAGRDIEAVTVLAN
jgi:hypothetical protein